MTSIAEPSTLGEVSVQEAERNAAQLLETSWWDSPDRTSPLPVDPKMLARNLGITVVETLLPTDESGNIVIPAAGEVVISLNASDHPNRRRFTCAHELGHYHRRKRQRTRSQDFTDYRDTLAGLGSDPDEIYANQFAAALLMPAHLVQRWHTQDDIHALAVRFATSTQAMEVRLRNLRLQ